MTWHWAVGPDWSLFLHRLLLRAAGQAPDDLVLRARRRLAEGRETDAAATVALAAHAGHLSLTDADASTLAAILTAAGHDATFLAARPRPGAERPVPFTTVASLTRELPGLDLTSAPADARFLDAYDRAAVRTVAGEYEPIGLWRAWRLPRQPAHHLPPRRIYLAQTRIGEVGLTARLQRALNRAGDDPALIEVFDAPSALPEFSQRALDQGVLLWAARPAAPVRIAGTFHRFGPDGLPDLAGRARLSVFEATKVADYLRAGAPIRLGAPPAADLLDPAGPPVVPTGLRGDGTWIWSEEVGYYLARYGIAPEPELLADIRAAGYLPPPVDAVVRHRGRAALLTAAAGVPRDR